MLVNIIQNFDTGSRRYYAGQNFDVDPQIARRWIADGWATEDRGGREDGILMPPRLQIVATRGNLQGEGTPFGGGASNYTRVESRLSHTMARVPVAGVRLVFCNFEITGASGEAASANAITVKASVELLSPNVMALPVFFGGSRTVTIQPGGYVISDPVGIEFTAGQAFFTRTSVTMNSGETCPAGLYMSLNGESCVASTSASSQVDATGIQSVPSGGAAQTFAYGPAAILGVPQSPTPAVLIIGDSITNGAGESSGYIGVPRGFVARGLVAASAGPIPYASLARGGTRWSGWKISSAPRSLFLAEYATHAIVALGTNDLYNVGDNLATTKADALEVIARLKARNNLPITLSKVMPRMSGSTDSYATPGGMTPISGFESGGAERDTYNAWLDAQKAQGVISDVVDPNPYVEDQVNLGKWITNGAANYPTTDGIHPTTALHALAAQAVAAWANTLA